ncbi:ATP-binding protein [Streptomyces sp. T21Q-yed]|nr:ATP-binding protein [Streptomyces sp. T21Q-yed]
MRRVTAARLRYCGLEALAEDVMTIVSELLTNAVLHSGTTEISLNLEVRDGFLRIVVIDGMPGHANASRKPVEDNAEAGRGLALVEALAKEHGGAWGTSDDGTETWCSLAVPDGDRP